MYKILFIGINEKILIGSVSTTGGTLSTMLPLFAISFLISLYLNSRKRLYLYLILGFLLMGLAGAKRGIWFYAPVLFIIGLYYYLRVSKAGLSSIKNLRYVLIFSLIIPVVFYFGVTNSPTLNPDKTIGGDFDIDYVSSYAYDYTFKEIESNETSVGRGANMLRVFEKMRKSEWQHVLFGYGPDSAKGISTYGEGIWGEFGIYGPIPGFATHWVQIGIMAIIILLVMMFSIARTLLKHAKLSTHPYTKAISLGCFLAVILFFIDYFTYSSSFFATTFPISFTFFYVLGYLLNQHRLQNA